MENLDIRLMVNNLRIKYKDIARQMGVSRVWLSTLMRYELSEENRARVLQAIMELQAGGSNDTRS